MNIALQRYPPKQIKAFETLRWSFYDDLIAFCIAAFL
jgi:hypothetical protein